MDILGFTGLSHLGTSTVLHLGTLLSQNNKIMLSLVTLTVLCIRNVRANSDFIFIKSDVGITVPPNKHAALKGRHVEWTTMKSQLLLLLMMKRWTENWI